MGERPPRIPLVFPTVRDAPLLHQFQHKLSPVRDVWHHIQTTNVATGTQQAQTDHHHQETVSIPVRLR